MISFTVLTDTPARLRNFLVSRSVIEQAVDPISGATVYRGTLRGMEWVEVPNPIVTDPGSGGDPMAPGYVPPTHDTRRVFMVKFAHESVNAEVDEPTTEIVEGETDVFGNPLVRQRNSVDYTKFGKWVKNNSSVVTAPAHYTINGEPVGDAYKVNGENVWLVRDRPERFGVWQ